MLLKKVNAHKYKSVFMYVFMYVCINTYILPQRSWDYSQERVGRFQIFKRKAASETLKGEFLNVRIFVCRMKMYVCMYVCSIFMIYFICFYYIYVFL